MPRKRISDGCTVDGCKEPYYAKGYCHNHYEKWRYSGNPDGVLVKCAAPGCLKKLKRTREAFCDFHQRRVVRGIALDSVLSSRCSIKGPKNPNWAGGISEYKNHALRKKNRLELIRECGGICQICGEGEGRFALSKNGDKDDSRKENLIISCHKCMCAIKFTKKKESSLYVRMYGFTAVELGVKMGLSVYQIRAAHRRGDLPEAVMELKGETNER